jgi:hypothetical protein
MSVNGKNVESIFKIVARPSKRSPLFIWMFENHDRVLSSSPKVNDGLCWAKLCAEFEQQGLPKRANKEPSGEDSKRPEARP